MKICFLAPSSYGKSTAVKIIERHFNSENVKIAEPLYDLQNKFYKYINRNIEDKQDGELLQYLGIKIRKENPLFLLENFKQRVDETYREIITNDDCRRPDQQYLQEMGFIFVKILGYQRDREDHTKVDRENIIEWDNDIICGRKDYTKVDRKNSIEWDNDICGMNEDNKIVYINCTPCDYVITNFGTMEEYEKTILNLMKEIAKDEKMLRNTKRKLLK